MTSKGSYVMKQVVMGSAFWLMNMSIINKLFQNNANEFRLHE